jgi:hypothetical protein
MKKIIVLISLILISAYSLWADSYSTLSSILQFHGDLSELANKSATIDPNKIFLVEGMVTAIRVINDTPSAYYAEADFMSARYNKDDSIQSFRIILVFSKPVFQNLLVAKSGRPLQDGQIGVNSRGLALIQYVNSVSTTGEAKIPVFLAHDFRILK